MRSRPNRQAAPHSSARRSRSLAPSRPCQGALPSTVRRANAVGTQPYDGWTCQRREYSRGRWKSPTCHVIVAADCNAAAAFAPVRPRTTRYAHQYSLVPFGALGSAGIHGRSSLGRASGFRTLCTRSWTHSTACAQCRQTSREAIQHAGNMQHMQHTAGSARHATCNAS